jgi:hypothetical protein
MVAPSLGANYVLADIVTEESILNVNLQLISGNAEKIQSGYET